MILQRAIPTRELVAVTLSFANPSLSAGPPPPAADSKLAEIHIRAWKVHSQFDLLRPVIDNLNLPVTDVKIGLGSIPPSVAVRQQLTIAADEEPLQAKEFGAEGGTLTLSAPKALKKVRITLAISFTPESGMPPYIKTFDQSLDARSLVGVIQLWPEESEFYIDYLPFGQSGDYLLSTLYIRRGGLRQKITHPTATTSGGLRTHVATFDTLSETDVPERYELFGRLNGSIPDSLCNFGYDELRTTTLLSGVWNCDKGRVDFVRKQ